MIVISDKPGQLGNLLFTYANFLVYGKEFHISVSNPAFYAYTHYFEITKHDSRNITKFNYRLAYLMARILYRLPFSIPFLKVKCLNWNEHFDLDHSQVDLNSRGFHFVQGWLYRAPQLLLKHKVFLKNFFKPSKEFESTLTAFFKRLDLKENEILIAIHIRRGDYANFEGGKFFYSLEKYAQFIDQAAKVFSQKKIRFLICSNEAVELKNLNRSNHQLVNSLQHELLDLYCMSQCNYIIGPPSTYSMWASFYGDVPLCQISSSNQTIMLSDFKRI